MLAGSIIGSLVWPASAVEVPPGESEGKTGSLFGRMPSGSGEVGGEGGEGGDAPGRGAA